MIGGVAGDAGDGAIGAATGPMAWRKRARKNRAAENQQAQQQQQQVLNTYYRAYGACMEGRGWYRQGCKYRALPGRRDGKCVEAVDSLQQ